MLTWFHLGPAARLGTDVALLTQRRKQTAPSSVFPCLPLHPHFRSLLDTGKQCGEGRGWGSSDNAILPAGLGPDWRHTERSPGPVYSRHEFCQLRGLARGW